MESRGELVHAGIGETDRSTIQKLAIYGAGKGNYFLILVSRYDLRGPAQKLTQHALVG